MTTQTEPESPQLRIDRRHGDRWPVHGVAVAHIVAGERFGERITMRLQNESDDGLGVVADRPLEPGAIVSVGFATPGQPIRTGVVVRCLPCGEGYRTAIRFETRRAA